MSNSGILNEGYEGISEIPEGPHPCCPKIGDEDEENYDDLEDPPHMASEKKSRIEEGKRRLDLSCKLSLVLGLTDASKERYQSIFDSRVDRYLNFCPGCIKNWHKYRLKFLKQLSE
jgi:senataxin